MLAAEGALKVGCIVKDGKILPAINSATRLASLANTEENALSPSIPFFSGA